MIFLFWSYCFLLSCYWSSQRSISSSSSSSAISGHALNLLWTTNWADSFRSVRLPQSLVFRSTGCGHMLLLSSHRRGQSCRICSGVCSACWHWQRAVWLIPNLYNYIKCYIEPVLTYGCESWTINKQIEKSLRATEMWFYRRMMRIQYTAKVTNVEVLNEVKIQSKHIINIRKRQSSFFGHVMRKWGL